MRTTWPWSQDSSVSRDSDVVDIDMVVIFNMMLPSRKLTYMEPNTLGANGYLTVALDQRHKETLQISY